jgi:hypothetical protein
MAGQNHHFVVHLTPARPFSVRIDAIWRHDLGGIRYREFYGHVSLISHPKEIGELILAAAASG